MKGSRHYLSVQDKEILLEALTYYQKNAPIGDLLKKTFKKLREKIKNETK